MGNAIVKIYLKGNKKPVCMMELENEDLLNDFLNELNGDKKYIKFYQLILDRDLFERADIYYK